jgi:transcriptional regulator with XRE-family HTH domain
MNTGTKEKLGVRLKKYRMSKIVTQEQLAKKLDISRVTLSQIENGNETVHDLTRAKIEKLLSETAAA